METSIIEVGRQTHEEIERYEQALVDIFLADVKGHKDRLANEHRASELLNRITARSQSLLGFYEDKDRARTSEISALSSSEFDEFYNRLAKIKDFHHKYPDRGIDTFDIDFSALEGVVGEEGLDFVDRMFSGEESAGRFLDLYVQHEQYLNLKGVRRISYLQYLEYFDRFDSQSVQEGKGGVSRETKKSDAYAKYLTSLHDYLSSFLRKTRPLSDMNSMEASAVEQFEKDWDAGQVPGWEDKGLEDSSKGKGKAKLTERRTDSDGIWCEACQRTYAKQTVYDAHLTSKKHVKAAERLASGDGAPTRSSATPANGRNGTSSVNDANAEREAAAAEARRAKNKALAQTESIIRAFAAELETVRVDTRNNVERKQALTDRERAAEVEADEDAGPATGNGGGGDGEDDDEEGGDERIYNPLKLPLGWDGKPIPYWLYKLHGLGVEYKCEICSDYVYMGRKNFERHFQESRHAFGMRALGLPNTKHFHEITRIEDAIALAEKLKREGKQEVLQTERMEEYEDEEGNTYDKKTYFDLKRQGLIN